MGDYKKIRYDYFNFMRDALENCYYQKVRSWCKKNGLSFSGHLMGEEYLSLQISQSIASMPFYKYFDIPGVDMLRSDNDWFDTPQVIGDLAEKKYVNRSMHVSAKQCVSIAEQVGIKLSFRAHR